MNKTQIWLCALTLLMTHTPPLWMLMLRSAPRASGAEMLVPRKPPDFGYASRRTGNNHHVPGTDEDVNIEPMDCLVCVRTGWFHGWGFDVAGRASASGGAQTGGEGWGRVRMHCCPPIRAPLPLPFTVCVRSLD